MDGIKIQIDLVVFAWFITLLAETLKCRKRKMGFQADPQTIQPLKEGSTFFLSPVLAKTHWDESWHLKSHYRKSISISTLSHRPISNNTQITKCEDTEKKTNERNCEISITCNILVVIIASVNSPKRPASHHVSQVQLGEINFPLILRPLGHGLVSRPNLVQTFLQLDIQILEINFIRPEEQIFTAKALESLRFWMQSHSFDMGSTWIFSIPLTFSRLHNQPCETKSNSNRCSADVPAEELSTIQMSKLHLDCFPMNQFGRKRENSTKR